MLKAYNAALRSLLLQMLYILAISAAALLSGTAAAQQAVNCEVVVCDEPRPKPRVGFSFEFLVKPAPKVVLPPKPKPVIRPPNTPKQKQPPNQKATVVKKPEPVRKKPPAKVAIVKRPDASKPGKPKPSWAGLEERPVIVLNPQDMIDIEGSYIVDLNVAALQAAGLDLAVISTADLATQLQLAPGQIRNIQRRFLFSVTLNATPQQAAQMAQNPLVSAVNADTQIKAAGGKTLKTDLPLSWGLDRLDAPSLPLDNSYDRLSGDYQTRIYVFDSGIKSNELEFKDRVAFGARFTPVLKNDDQGCDAHGTEMASLLAGKSTGSAPKAFIVDLVVLPCNSEQTGSASSLIEAVEWLLMREADFGDGKPAVANMSLAGKWSRSINNAVSILTKNNVAVVVAAGNNGDDACRYSPASAKDAVTVAATGPDDETPGFSNFGGCVDIHSPGRLLTTLSVDHTAKDQPFIYVATSGTSGATALVSGLLARSLKVKGPKAASQWLLEAGAPAEFWRKDSDNKFAMLLAQASPQWRSSCRVAGLEGGLELRARPGPQGKPIKTLASNSVVVVETAGNGWARIKDGNAAKGWVALQTADKPNLFDLKANIPCNAVR
jgi:Subtilase family